MSFPILHCRFLANDRAVGYWTNSNQTINLKATKWLTASQFLHCISVVYACSCDEYESYNGMQITCLERNYAKVNDSEQNRNPIDCSIQSMMAFVIRSLDDTKCECLLSVYLVVCLFDLLFFSFLLQFFFSFF